MRKAWGLQKTPRKWQLDASASWIGAGGRGIISVVTGAGKTFLGLMLAERMSRLDNRIRILVCVPTLALLDQWKVAFIQDLSVQESEISCFGAGYGASGETNRVNIAVVNTARTKAQDLVQGTDNHWMLIADECHRYGSPRNKEVLQLPYRWTLGLSATPEREYDTGFEDYLVPGLGEVVFRYDHAAAKRDGVISPFALWNYRVPLMSDEEEQYHKLTKKIGSLFRAIRTDYTKVGRRTPNLPDLLRSGEDDRIDSLRALLLRRRSVAINARYRLPAAARIAMSFGSEQTLVFHERIEQANRLHELIGKMGLRSTIYHSKVSPVRRSFNLMVFRRGAVSVLVTCRALDEGLDVPEASIGIIAASTRSTRQRIQRMGRILRKSPAKDYAIVCTLYATDAEEADLRAQARGLEDVAEVQWYDVESGGSLT